MNKYKIAIIILSLTVIIILNTSEASSFSRCGKSFVNKGDSVGTVYSKCGDPDFVYESSGGGAIKKVESWNYKNKTFHIKDGRVKRIETRIPKRRKSWLYGRSF